MACWVIFLSIPDFICVSRGGPMFNQPGHWIPGLNSFLGILHVFIVSDTPNFYKKLRMINCLPRFTSACVRVFGDLQQRPRQSGATSTGGLHFWWCSSSTESRFLGWKPKISPILVVCGNSLIEDIALWIWTLYRMKPKIFDRVITKLVHCFLIGDVAFRKPLCSTSIVLGGS
jgi:hypothetical protein